MASDLRTTYDNVCTHARETAVLNSIESLLSWDEQVLLPAEGAEYRAEQARLMAGLGHARETDLHYGAALGELAASSWAADRQSDSGATIYHLKRRYDKRTRLPQRLVEALAEATVLAQQTWQRARKQNDFAMFAPHLDQVLRLKREEAQALCTGGPLYDALLDDYEPLAKSAEVGRVLADLRAELVPLVAQIAEARQRPDERVLAGSFAVAAQEALGRKAAATIGFDFQRGRLDVSAHPFCSTVGPRDCRLTTRYREHDFGDAFFSTLHETGHGLYEQGLPAEHYGLPLGEAVSLGIHESQSRMWENLVGRGLPFWEFFYPQLQAAFPAFRETPLDAFYGAANRVQPSLIRTESDEATYNLHICVRFELEQALLVDELRVGDLPGAWQERYRDVVGAVSTTDADGVLQDVHWAAGLLGYFPTYTLGNLYAAQFFEQAIADLGDLPALLRRGETGGLLGWLRDKIHRHGKRYSAAELVQRVTGRPLSHAALMNHLRSKLGPLYGF
ncbi:MAG: carboxypeptidase M32 [Pirellulales bacterium]|nr:carboxypeptidase M32 [Pirellulales bacterium]